MTSIQTESKRPSREQLSSQWSSYTRESDLPFPLVLQQCAPGTVRRHARANALRVAMLLGADLVAVAVALAALRWIGPSFVLKPLLPASADQAMQSRAISGLVVAVIVGLWVLRCYRAGDFRRDPSRIALGVALGAGLAYWQPVWDARSLLPAVAYVFGAASIAVTVVVARFAVNLGARRFRVRTGRANRTLVVGGSADLRLAQQHAAVGDEAEFAIVESIDIERRPDLVTSSAFRQMIATLRRESIDTVVIAGSLQDELFDRLLHLADAAGCSVYVLPRPIGFAGLESHLVWRRGEPMFEMTRPGLRGQQLLAKRLLDVLVAGAGLLLLSPAMFLIAVAVKSSSAGPVFFRQERVGKGGRTFRIFKFRSMSRDAEEQKAALAEHSVYQDARLFKMKCDPRVTRVGAFLRRTSLDELPQLINVLRGEMSLVGPRPPVPSEVAFYEEHHFVRFDMRPGITGPWQVGGRNNITDFEAIVRLEVSYMRQWSIWKDFEILAKTLPAVLRMDGAH